MNSFVIRNAKIEDAAEIARIQIDGWKTAFKGIVSQSYLDEMNYEQRTKRFEQVIDEAKERFHWLVSTSQGEITGFTCGGANRSDRKDYDGELWAIFVAPQLKGQGIGKKLFSATVERLRKDRFEKMLLWCLKANEPSLTFYKSLGGQALPERLTDIGGQKLAEIGFGWNLSD